MDERSEQVREEFMDIATADMGINWSDEHIGYTIKKMADEIVRLRHALWEANRPPEDAEHHPYHWGEMADMAIDAAVRIAQSDTSRCLSCGAWV